MKRLFVATATIAALTAAAALTTPAFAATSPFAGSWKLDAAKSKFTGDTFSYIKTAGGFKYSNGSTMAYDFKIDGKDYPTAMPGRTTSWSPSVGGGYDTVAKQGGKILAKAHRKLSADGKSLTVDETIFMADGTTTHESGVLKRLSGTSGLAGKWEEVKVEGATDAITIATPSAGHYEIATPSDKEIVVGTLDGAEAALKGPTVPLGATASYKAHSSTIWAYTMSIGGKPHFIGVMTVAADGKTLTDKSWEPGKESEASLGIYDRQ